MPKKGNFAIRQTPTGFPTARSRFVSESPRMEWYRWFPAFYNQDTLHLDLEADAIYRRLIDWYMVARSPLIASPMALARICQISLDKWAQHEKQILPFFQLKNGFYHHKRCDFELDRQDSMGKILSEAGKKGAKARYDNKAKSSTSLASASEGYSLSMPEKEKEKEKEKDSNIIPIGIMSGAVQKAPAPALADSPSEYSGEKNKNSIHPKKLVSLANDFDPEMEWAEYGQKLGLSDKEVQVELESFIAYWTVGKGQDARKTTRGWRQAWSNWLSISIKKRR